MASTAMADPGVTDNDANSGTDAGNRRLGALGVSYDTTYNARVRGTDVDWYTASLGPAAPTCVRLAAASDSPSYFALGAENADGTTSAPFLIGAGSQASGGIASQTPLISTLRVARAADGGPGHYSFRFERVGIPAAGDAGTGGDAGGIDAPLAVQPGCIGGHLDAIGSLDMRDVYAVRVAPGEVVTYSLTSNTGGHTLELLDAAGSVVGPAIGPGQLASIALPTSGTYFVSATRTTAIGDVGYLAGIIVGPEPTGCRPYCME